jgi:ureidoacrylate peracid hydrolase
MNDERFFQREPGDFALIVIDMQNDYCHPEGIFAKEWIKAFNVELIVERIKNTMEFCKSKRIPIICLRWVIRSNADGNPVDAGLYPEVRSFLMKEGLRQNTWGARLIDSLPEPDFDIEKSRPSGFYNTNLEVLLRGLRSQILIFSGIFTNQCVVSTARDAWARDFRFVVLEDCTAASDYDLHQSTLRSLSVIGKILDSHTLIEKLNTYHRSKVKGT